MNAAGIPPLKITGSDSKKDSKEIRNYLEIALQGPLNSKGIKMKAAGSPPLKITGNDSKKDSKEI